jgi:hypothetical protein
VDVKQTSGPKLEYAGDSNQAFAELEVEEISGPGSLPGAQTLPAGLPTASGVAIWPFEQDWSNNLEVEFRREGSSSSDGRDSYFIADGTKERMRTKYLVGGDRDATLDLIGFFEYHKGRLVPFWHLDPQCHWTVHTWQPGSVLNRILLDPLGLFADFQADVAEILKVGIVLTDGTFLIRTVSTTSSGTFWTMNLTSNLPTGYTAANVKHIALARKTRFDSDTLAEGWGAIECAKISTELLELTGE